jgi:hypothetical protein
LLHLTEYYYGDKIKEAVVGRSPGMHASNEKHIVTLWLHDMKRDNYRRLGLKGRINLIYIPMKSLDSFNCPNPSSHTMALGSL